MREALFCLYHARCWCPDEPSERPSAGNTLCFLLSSCCSLYDGRLHSADMSTHHKMWGCRHLRSLNSTICLQIYISAVLLQLLKYHFWLLYGLLIEIWSFFFKTCNLTCSLSTELKAEFHWNSLLGFGFNFEGQNTLTITFPIHRCFSFLILLKCDIKI